MTAVNNWPHFTDFRWQVEVLEADDANAAPHPQSRQMPAVIHGALYDGADSRPAFPSLVLQAMFGAFRCSRHERNALEFVDLSRNSSVNARNYTVVVSEPFLPTVKWARQMLKQTLLGVRSVSESKGTITSQARECSRVRLTRSG